MNLTKNQKFIIAFFIAVFLLFGFMVFVPKSFGKSSAVIFDVKKGMDSKKIAVDLQKEGLIKNNIFFRLYVILLNKYTKLQAGRYHISSSMSVAQIVKKMTSGDTIKDTATIIEGWNLQDMAKYLEDKKIYSSKEFLDFANSDFSYAFIFLSDKPKKLSLEGYLFPDTYEISLSENPEDFIKNMLENFDKKLTPDLRAEITKQKKSIFQIITMASLIEKEVKTLEDKKIVSGILWKRIKEGMPLQVDATVNYITGNNHPGVAIKDTKIDSPYNTYKYYGLPLGPISNPGLDSILASIYPIKSEHWYYLSDQKTGKTIFSKTLEEHNIAIYKHLK